MSAGGYVPSDADLVRAVQAERKANLNLIYLEVERQKAAAEECLEAGDDDEAERHRWDAETLERIAKDIEMRGGKAP